jgi:uncharacterized lipoprotein YddW (UPF0748 family)
MNPAFLLTVVSVCVVLACAASARAETPMDHLDYPSDQAAQAAWRPLEDTAPVSMAEVEGRRAVRFPCRFKETKGARAYWDHAVALDLAACRGLQFLFYCRDAKPVSGFTAYLQSGNGWYRKPIEGGRPGWNLVRVDKAETEIEGTPAGWGKVQTLRVAAWRAADEDTEFFLADLGPFGGDAPLVVLRNEAVAKERPGELHTVAAQCALTSRLLDDLALPHVLVNDLDLTPERLKGKQIVLLPHAPGLPDETVGLLTRFMQEGGKVIGFYSVPEKIRQAAGIEGGRWIGQKYAGYYSSIRAAPADALKDAPPVVGQKSWNISEAKPLAGRSRVAAYWYNEKGESTGDAAIVASDNCILMTHVLLSDDLANKRWLLLAMLGQFRPELWKTAAQAALERLGRFGPFKGWEDAETALRAATPGPEALKSLAKAGELRAKARGLLADGKPADVLALAGEAEDALLSAHAAAQKPVAGEHRAFWCHSAFGVAGMTWDAAAELLARNGFTAILPNMLWGGTAFYESRVLPVAPEVQTQGDQIAKCLAACKKYGLQCHVWKVNWNTGGRAPKEFLDKLKQEGRAQAGFDGKPEPWLCPSHPENQKLEIDAMVEVATKYDVDGVHFDYIRYPDNEHCFCAGCRERFAKAVGAAVENWPRAVRQDADLKRKWGDFRREQITKVVAAVSAAVRQAKPKVKISAAVFQNWATDRESVGQDWKLWCEKGYLDFVCPMDYVEETGRFENLVERQLTWAGKVPCYPGIGLSCWPPSPAANFCELVAQVGVTRKLKTGGFTIFEYAAREAKDIVPRCGLGLTRKE